MHAPRIHLYLAKAYFWQYRVRANVPWLLGSALGFTPVLLILAYVAVDCFPHLDRIFYITLSCSCLWFLGFVASRDGLTLMLRNRLELTIHVPRAYVASKRRRTVESFVTDVSEIILWARQMGFRTVTMDSPLLHQAARRINLAADLQLMCGDGVSVNSLDALRRVPFVEHHAFMLLRSKWSIYGIRTALIYFMQNGKMPERQPDGLTRDRGRLVSGRIVVTFPNTAHRHEARSVNDPNCEYRVP